MEFHQFRNQLSYDGDLTNRFRGKSLETKNADGQADVGHINLIGGLHATRLKCIKCTVGLFTARREIVQGDRKEIEIPQGDLTSSLNISTKALYSISGCKCLLFGIIAVMFLFPMSVLSQYKVNSINKDVKLYFMFHNELIPNKVNSQLFFCFFYFCNSCGGSHIGLLLAGQRPFQNSVVIANMFGKQNLFQTLVVIYPNCKSKRKTKVHYRHQKVQ